MHTSVSGEMPKWNRSDGRTNIYKYTSNTLLFVQTLANTLGLAFSIV